MGWNGQVFYDFLSELSLLFNVNLQLRDNWESKAKYTEVFDVGFLGPISGKSIDVEDYDRQRPGARNSGKGRKAGSKKTGKQPEIIYIEDDGTTPLEQFVLRQNQLAGGLATRKQPAQAAEPNPPVVAQGRLSLSDIEERPSDRVSTGVGSIHRYSPNLDEDVPQASRPTNHKADKGGVLSLKNLKTARPEYHEEETVEGDLVLVDGESYFSPSQNNHPTSNENSASTSARAGNAQGSFFFLSTNELWAINQSRTTLKIFIF